LRFLRKTTETRVKDSEVWLEHVEKKKHLKYFLLK